FLIHPSQATKHFYSIPLPNETRPKPVNLLIIATSFQLLPTSYSTFITIRSLSLTLPLISSINSSKHMNKNNQPSHTGTLVAGMLMGAGAVILANKELRNKLKHQFNQLKVKTNHSKHPLNPTAQNKITQKASDPLE